MIVSAALKELAELLGGDLYVVGGAVRDDILGKDIYDIDIASPLRAEEVKERLTGTEFRVVPNSLKLGTLGISVRGEKYEYTAFRKDSYGVTGAHTPCTVSFGAALEEDAFRRDFTINAIYYNILSGRTVDLTGGMADIEKRIIRTVRDPREVIAEDALRIMRMARFAAELGFDMDEGTMRCATEMSNNLSNIAPERIRAEFDKILVADSRHGVTGGQVRGLEILVKCGAMRYVVPELLEGIGMEQNADWHKYDVYGHILATVANAPKEIRLAAFFHDIAKPVMRRTTGKSKGHDVKGAEMTEARMTELRYGKAVIKETCALVAAHMFDLKCDESEQARRVFIQEHIDILDKLILLKDADWAGGGTHGGSNPSADRLRELVNVMRKEGVPFSISELPIGGEDVAFLPPEKRGQALKALLKRAAFDPEVRTSAGAIEFLKSNM